MTKRKQIYSMLDYKIEPMLNCSVFYSKIGFKTSVLLIKELGFHINKALSTTLILKNELSDRIE